MSSTTIVQCSPCYELKYDEKEEKFRDQTFNELKISYGKNTKIKCNCKGEHAREYKADSSFVSTHMKSIKHINWREEEIKEHKKNYGHCISSEKVIETLRKEVREYKKQVANIDNKCKNKDEKMIFMSNKIDILINENDLFKIELEENENENNTLSEEIKKYKKEIISIKNENDENDELDELSEQVKEYEKDIISLRKENDKIKHELNTYKLKKDNKKQLIKPRFR